MTVCEMNDGNDECEYGGVGQGGCSVRWGTRKHHMVNGDLGEVETQDTSERTCGSKALAERAFGISFLFEFLK